MTDNRCIINYKHRAHLVGSCLSFHCKYRRSMLCTETAQKQNCAAFCSRGHAVDVGQRSAAAGWRHRDVTSAQASSRRGLECLRHTSANRGAASTESGSVRRRQHAWQWGKEPHWQRFRMYLILFSHRVMHFVRIAGCRHRVASVPSSSVTLLYHVEISLNYEMCSRTIFYILYYFLYIIYYRVGRKKPSPILFCLKWYCICL